mmetsp:Transcript_39014/g.65571  ORF Transcript_39014/g.65571 Transcript_39014/m.65571 type:complete len:229 (+) Transcript_39014:1328-2014(+)
MGGADGHGRAGAGPLHAREELEAARDRERDRLRRVEPRDRPILAERRLSDLLGHKGWHRGGQGSVQGGPTARARPARESGRPLVGLHRAAGRSEGGGPDLRSGRMAQGAGVPGGAPRHRPRRLRGEYAQHGEQPQREVPRVGGVLGEDVPPHQRLVRYPADALALRAVRPQPAVRAALRDRARRARGRRPQGHGGALQPLREHRYRVELRGRGDPQPDQCHERRHSDV